MIYTIGVFSKGRLLHSIYVVKHSESKIFDLVCNWIAGELDKHFRHANCYIAYDKKEV